MGSQHKYPEAAIDRDRPLKGGLVHRLDNGTSGALIVARTAEACAVLRAAIKSGAIRREYRLWFPENLKQNVRLPNPSRITQRIRARW